VPKGYSTRQMLQAAAVANGNGAPLDVSGLTWLGIQIVGVTTATVNFETSLDGGVTWVALPVTSLVAAGTVVTTATADGAFRANVGGLLLVRARISGWSAGTISVYAFGSTEG
jgi:hypothetical protein